MYKLGVHLTFFLHRMFYWAKAAQQSLHRQLGTAASSFFCFLPPTLRSAGTLQKHAGLPRRNMREFPVKNTQGLRKPLGGNLSSFIPYK